MVTTKYTIQMSNILARKLFFLADSFLSLMYLKGMKLASFCYFIIFPSKFASHHITNIHDVSIIMRRICEFCALNNEIWMKRTPFFSLTTKKNSSKRTTFVDFLDKSPTWNTCQKYNWTTESLCKMHRRSSLISFVRFISMGKVDTQKKSSVLTIDKIMWYFGLNICRSSPGETISTFS